ncbi:hypothetical protein [Mesobacillus subterraneus]|uniref:DUF4367 domain-containing protein n=1 Tax=Mesobacillus subterraneus TaxID=285983 RepID=A0A3R9FIB3_9BACI|nr:hypothetical protein [Mesobacillus subterraneus]RSD27066.1 hypothetical protein EJA10_11015 [Mesobacillus subterraneus]
MMEKKLNQLKSEMLKGELAGFKFTPDMKRDVMKKMDTHGGRFNLGRLVPLTLSLAFVAIFLVGIGTLIRSGYNEGPAELLKQPELVAPSYVPEPYEFKHTKVSDESYTHFYVNPADPTDQFSYRMQKAGGDLDNPSFDPVGLAPGLDGHYSYLGENHSYLWWKAEGYYQIVEQTGLMSKADLLKVTDSILQEKGYETLLADDIERELAQQVEYPPAGKLTREDAVEMLIQYEMITRSVEIEEGTQRVKDIETKEDYYALYSKIMTRQQAFVLFEPLLEETSEGLFFAATEYPPFFEEAEPFEFHMSNDKEYTLVQEQNSELHGKIKLIFGFAEDIGKWKINYFRVDDGSSGK